MKKIFEVHGKTIISVIVALAVIAAMGIVTYNNRTGIFAILGGEFEDAATAGNADDSSFVTASYASYSARKKPEVSYESYNGNGDWQRIKAGEEVYLSDFFRGMDEDGNEVAILKVTDIQDESGKSLMDVYDESDGSITFTDAGIYTATFYMKDAQNVENTQLITFPVDN